MAVASASGIHNNAVMKQVPTTASIRPRTTSSARCGVSHQRARPHTASMPSATAKVAA